MALILIGALVLLLCAATVWAMMSRVQNGQDAAVKDAQEKAAQGSKPAGFLSDSIATAGAESTAAPSTGGQASNSNQAPQTQAEPSGSTMQDPRAQAWQAYFQKLAAVQQEKAEAAQKAMTADTDAVASKPGGGDQPAGQFQTGSGLPDGLGGTGLGMPGALGQGLGGQGQGPQTPIAGADAGGQAEKRAFLGSGSNPLGVNEDLMALVHGPKPNTIMEGTAIQATMRGGLTTDMPGMVVADISLPVCDSKTGTDLLIPQSTKAIGHYDNSVSNGQERVGVIWDRLIFPDTSSLQIGGMEGADQGGYAGFHDRVDTHFWSKLGNALLITVAGSAAQLSQPQQSYGQAYSPSAIASGQLGQQFSQLGREYAQAGLSVPNTIEIRPGYRFTILANKDVKLPSRGSCGGGASGVSGAMRSAPIGGHVMMR